MSPATVSTSTWAARCDSASTTWATVAEPKRPNPSRKSSGVPSTTTTSARCLSRPLVRRNASSWSAGIVPRPRPFVNTGTRRCSTAATSASSAPAQYTSLPTRNAGRSAPATSSASRAMASGSGSTPRPAAVSTAGTSPADGPNTSSGKSRNTGPRCGWAASAMASWTITPALAGSVTVAADFVIDCRIGTWSSSCSDPAPHRPCGARPPSTTTRRAVEPRRRHGRHAVGDPRPGGERGDARTAGQLGVGLGGERRRLLVAHVDDGDALVAGGLVQRPDVTTVQREHDVHPEALHRRDRLLAGVPFDVLPDALLVRLLTRPLIHRVPPRRAATRGSLS